MKQFWLYIDNVIVDTNDVCTCSSVFIPFRTSTLLIKEHSELVSVIKVSVIVDDDLDRYGHTNNNSHFCNFYYNMIIEKKIPKFGSSNCINNLPCEKYPDVSSDLTFVKESFVICAHPLVSVINLRPSITSSTASYH